MIYGALGATYKMISGQPISINHLDEIAQFCHNIKSSLMENLISRDGGKWWSNYHHLVVVKILKNVDFSLKNVKKW